MKRPQEDRDRWLRQAEHDLEVARRNLADAFYADACYYAEQTAQKALKGYGGRNPTASEHRYWLQRVTTDVYSVLQLADVMHFHKQRNLRH